MPLGKPAVNGRQSRGGGYGCNETQTGLWAGCRSGGGRDSSDVDQRTAQVRNARGLAALYAEDIQQAVGRGQGGEAGARQVRGREVLGVFDVRAVPFLDSDRAAMGSWDQGPRAAAAAAAALRGWPRAQGWVGGCASRAQGRTCLPMCLPM